MTFLPFVPWIDIARDLIVLACLLVFISASIGAKYSRLSYYKWLGMVIGTVTGLILTGLSLQGMAKSMATAGPLGFFSTVFTLGPVLPYLYEGVISAVLFGVFGHLFVVLAKKIQPHMPGGTVVAIIVCLSLLFYSPFSLTRRQMQMQSLLEQDRHGHADLTKTGKARQD